MDGELLRWLYHRLIHDPTLARTRNCTYGDGLILLIYFYAALNDRSPLWASDARHWPAWCRAATVKWPSYSQLNKRLNTDGAARGIDRINAELRDRLPHTSAKVVDGKPLTIGGFSHDPDAAWGKVPGGWANGYKLHVLADAGGCGVIDACAVTALDAGARRPCCAATSCPAWTSVRARCGPTGTTTPTRDVRRRRRRRRTHGGAPRRRPGTGLGHDVRQHPDRLRAIEELERTPGGRPAHERMRNRVEQSLAHLTNLPWGLWALPNFVRRLPRVRLWVAAKIALYHLYKVLTRAAAA